MGLSKSAVVLVALLVSATPAAAQTLGMVCGTVTDPSGATVPGVAVALKRGPVAPMTATTGKDGDYLLPTVAEGTYTLTFALDGFKKSLRNGVVVTAGREFRIDQLMQLSSFDTAEVASASVAYDRPAPSVRTIFTKTISDRAQTVRPCPVSKN